MSLVKKYQAEVVSVTNPLTNIYTVEFRSLDKGFKYKPGQFLHLSLDEYDPTKAWPESRCFSMQTSPESKTIKITFAVKGKFTTRMTQELVKGKVIYLKLPFGDLFTKEHNKNKNVFIAGGTGITPFLSLLTDSSFANYINPKLYFGIRSSTYNLYNDSLLHANRINKSLLVYVICEDKEGVLDIKTMFKENGKDAIYFISGPPIMIKCFKSFLSESGVNSSNIRSDEWE